MFKSSVASTHLSFVIVFFRQNTSYPVHFHFDHTTHSVQKSVSICDMGFPCRLDGKESACNAVDPGLIPRLGRPLGEWQPTPVFLPGECHGQRSLASYSLWGCKESDMTEQLTFPSSSSNIPLNIHITVSLSIYPLMETNYFHVLAIINNASVNIGMQICLFLLFLFCRHCYFYIYILLKYS